MYIVRGYFRPKSECNNQIIETHLSGPFETHGEASRFATGLAKTGQAYKAEIIYQDALRAARALYKQVEKMRNNCIIEKCGPLMDAMDCLTAAIIAIEKHYEDEPIPYTVADDVEKDVEWRR